jgi:hypothetical protein
LGHGLSFDRQILVGDVTVAMHPIALLISHLIQAYIDRVKYMEPTMF